MRATGPRVPPIPTADRDGGEVVVSVEALFGPTIAERVGRSLLRLHDGWLPSVPADLLRRDVRLTTFSKAKTLTSAAFVKSPGDKSFAAEVYRTGAAQPAELDPQTPALIAEPVRWEDEYRCFCLDGAVRAVSPYLRNGTLAAETDFAATGQELTTASAVAERVLAAAASPRAIVVDVGRIAGRGWAVVEANEPWGSGLYGCERAAAFDVIRAATYRDRRE